MQELLENLRTLARALGFASLWVTDATPFPDWRRAVARRNDGWGGALCADPQTLLPQARRILVLAYPYWQPPEPDFPRLRVSAYYTASQTAYQRAPELALFLHAGGHRTLAHPALPAKPAARRAGAGTLGRNGLLFTAEHGSRVILQLLLTDAELPLSPPRKACDSRAPYDPYEGCGACDACVRACPTGALGGEGGFDASLCLRAHMLSGTVTPEPLRPLMSNRLLGCEVCQQVCPRNAAAQAQGTSPPLVSPSLEALLGPEERLTPALRALGEAVGGNYARRMRVQAQAALLAGNSGDGRFAATLAPLCGSPYEALRVHARWAMARLN